MTGSYAYLAILALHLAALALFGGMVLTTDLRLLGVGMLHYSTGELLDGLRTPKRIGLALAVVSGAALFSFHPGQYLHNSWFWAKIALLFLLGFNYLLFERSLRSPKLAGGLSLLLWTGVVITGRGPATIKDVMHSMIDPSGDFVFASVKQVADEHGSHQEAPETDADWDDLRRRLATLQQAPSLLDGRRGARMRDRSRNPQSESQPEEIESALDADRQALLRRARKLQAAATRAMLAADARDIKALLQSIDSVDKACENCHLHYWYPKDKRAQQAAQEDGVTDN
jgi:hypothetical protein